MQIIISAGGGGTRLWPLSTNSHPKQFIPILDDDSLLEKTYRILSTHFPPEQIWVTTLRDYVDAVKKLLPPTFNRRHILVEPERKDTFAAISAQAAIVSHYTGEAEPLIFVPSDDWIQENEIGLYVRTLQKIGEALVENKFDIITVGIKPTYPSTNYGYIKVAKSDLLQIYEKAVPIISFREKPNEDKAEEFISSGDYLWHKHNPSFTFSKLKHLLQVLDPKSLEILEHFERTGEIVPEQYTKLPKIAFDYAILEQAEKIGVVGMDISWEDIGNWQVVYKNAEGLNQNQIEIQGTGNKVKLDNPDKKVAFVGVSNLLLVESDEGLLIIDPKFSPEVKKVAEYFGKN